MGNEQDFNGKRVAGGKGKSDQECMSLVFIDISTRQIENLKSEERCKLTQVRIFKISWLQQKIFHSETKEFITPSKKNPSLLSGSFSFRTRKLQGGLYSCEYFISFYFPMKLCFIVKPNYTMCQLFERMNWKKFSQNLIVEPFHSNQIPITLILKFHHKIIAYTPGKKGWHPHEGGSSSLICIKGSIFYLSFFYLYFRFLLVQRISQVTSGYISVYLRSISGLSHEYISPVEEDVWLVETFRLILKFISFINYLFILSLLLILMLELLFSLSKYVSKKCIQPFPMLLGSVPQHPQIFQIGFANFFFALFEFCILFLFPFQKLPGEEILCNMNCQNFEQQTHPSHQPTLFSKIILLISAAATVTAIIVSNYYHKEGTEYYDNGGKEQLISAAASNELKMTTRQRLARLKGLKGSGMRRKEEISRLCCPHYCYKLLPQGRHHGNPGLIPATPLFLMYVLRVSCHLSFLLNLTLANQLNLQENILKSSLSHFYLSLFPDCIIWRYSRVSKSLHISNHSISSPLILRNHGYPLGLTPNSYSLWCFIITQSTIRMSEIIISVECAANKYVKYVHNIFQILFIQ
ncbi:hypothetical protein VP01_1988g4 [Puccinia sorghi]|uniref:Uncharacterized protein n=1 Tax=Puccinia sorghi TaxID=27349 RepID=A0A0L6VBN0_9BASI|nr:hypothetical protein VP01_1988g4 [Puccinia sorghi]